MLIHLSYVLIGGMHEPWGGTRRPILSCEDAELCECVNDAVTCQGKWNQMKSNEGKELYYMILSWKVITFEVLLIIISIRILSLWRCFQTFSLMYKDWYLNKYVFHVKPPLEIHFTQLKKVIIFKCQLNNRGVQITEPIHQANYTAVMEPYRMWPDWQIHEAMIGF